MGWERPTLAGDAVFTQLPIRDGIPTVYANRGGYLFGWICLFVLTPLCLFRICCHQQQRQQQRRRTTTTASSDDPRNTTAIDFVDASNNNNRNSGLDDDDSCDSEPFPST